MTKEQLDAIRAQYTAKSSSHVGFALLAEVERLTAERDTLRELADRAAAEQGLAQRRTEQAQKARDAAFQRGVAAMREAAAKRCEVSPFFDKVTTVGLEYADAVRALPDPEDK